MLQPASYIQHFSAGGGIGPASMIVKTMIFARMQPRSGFPEDFQWGVKVINTLVEGVDAKIALHVCYGNRYGKPSWAGNYRYLFPAILEAMRSTPTLRQ